VNWSVRCSLPVRHSQPFWLALSFRRFSRKYFKDSISWYISVRPHFKTRVLQFPTTHNNMYLYLTFFFISYFAVYYKIWDHLFRDCAESLNVHSLIWQLSVFFWTFIIYYLILLNRLCYTCFTSHKTRVGYRIYVIT